MLRDIGEMLLCSIVMLLLVNMVLFSYGPNQHGPRHPTAHITKSLERCIADKARCEGGFIQKKYGPILRLSDCRKKCGLYELDLSVIEQEMQSQNPTLPAELQGIVLPGDETDWERARYYYERQFVRA